MSNSFSKIILIEREPFRPVRETGIGDWALDSLQVNGGSAMESEGRYFSGQSPNDIGDDVYLKKRKQGPTYTFFVSGDGEQWRPEGIPFEASYGYEQIGLFAISPVSGRHIPAKFEYSYS